jgi:hypothetical protein
LVQVSRQRTIIINLINDITIPFPAPSKFCKAAHLDAKNRWVGGE